MGENRYIILPSIGFKSREMEVFAPGGDKVGRPGGAVTTSAAPALGGRRLIDLKVVDGVAEAGPKAVEMSTADAQEFRRLPQYRLVPVRKYHPARRPLTAISLKALSLLWKGKAKEQVRVFVKEQGTNRPLPDVAVIAIVDEVTGAGLRRRTGTSGFATFTYPQGRRIRQLSIYPPPGFWGKHLENPALSDGFEIFLTPLDPDYPDLQGLRTRFLRDLGQYSEPVVSTKNSTTTERAYRIEKQRLLVGTCQVDPQPNWPRHRRRIMTKAKHTWSIWQALLNAFAWAFTRRGFHHFAEWITATALNVEEHTITQSVLPPEQYPEG